MTVKEARTIAEQYHRKPNPSDEDFFIFTEAMDFLIREQNNPRDMMHLGGVYYGRREFDLALKYYEMASTFDIDAADECLGYIWYYGRTGERDYEKAFKHYSRSMERGNYVSTYKVADMYKNGYYVEENFDKYKEIIENLYEELKGYLDPDAPIPEVWTRLARIRKDEGKLEDAANLYLQAKDVLAERLRWSDFFGDINIMKWLIDDLYEIIEFDPEYVDFFDLYYVLKRPARVTFYYVDEKHTIESLIEDGVCVVRFDDKWYRDRDEFFKKARLDDRKLTSIHDYLYGFEVKSILYS